MSFSPDQPLVSSRGLTWQTGAYVDGAAATGDGRYFVLGFGDGTVGVLDLTNADAGLKPHQIHNGGGLSFSAGPSANSFLSGGDDGKVMLITLGREPETLADLKGKWIDHVTAAPATGLSVFASGKSAFVIGKKRNEDPRELKHESSVGGIAVNPKGRRLAVAHYGGVSLWWLAAKDGAPQLLPWKGSHLQTAWSPDGTYVVTAMQENSLHGWRL
ncbi:MAG: WD40 repeat domain-containing protein, partial [Rhodobacteraceae bacterium]|nr:WD40 repeat domain-containing protein [Paracoccaceae bacterium]